MTSINRLPSPNATTLVPGVTDTTTTTPPWLRPLFAVHPNLATDYAKDAGLRAFLDVNKASIVQSEKAPAGKIVDKATWTTWCHTTNIVPAVQRDQEYIVVIARGSAYANSGSVKLPLQGGGEATGQGRIVFVGKTADFLASQEKADEGGSYPGAICIDIAFPVAGDPGEAVELSYSRVKPDAQGRLHSSQSGWADGLSGVYGGFSGRNTTLTVSTDPKVARAQEIDCPNGTSIRATSTLVPL
jgi:hypothetical protein